MTWFRVDDGWWSHRKTLAVSDAAAGLFIKLGCYSAHHLTDGVVPGAVIGTLSTASAEVRAALLAELRDVGFVRQTRRGRAEMVEIHDYLEYNPSREKVLADRKRRADLGHKGGVTSAEKRKRTVEAHGSTWSKRTVEADGEVPSRPVPSRPVPSQPDPSTTTEGTEVVETWEGSQGLRIARIAKWAAGHLGGIPDTSNAQHAEVHLAQLAEEEAEAVVGLFCADLDAFLVDNVHCLRFLKADRVNRYLAQLRKPKPAPIHYCNGESPY